MNDREPEVMQAETEESQVSTDIPAAGMSAAGGENDAGTEPVTQARRGRGRPPKNPPQAVQAEGEKGRMDVGETAVTETGQEIAEKSPQDQKASSAPTQDYALIAHGIQLLTEIVRSQSQTQESLMKAQTEFSNSVMDRMDQYRSHTSKLESEAAEREKERLRDLYEEAQRKADESMEEINTLKTQLDLANRKNLKPGMRIEKLTAECEDTRKKLEELKDQKTVQAAAEAVAQNPAVAETSSGPEEEGAADTGAPAEPERQTGLFGGWKKKRRRKFLEKVYCDRRYSDMQISVIQDADRSGVTLSDLKEMCDPNIAPAKMQVMLSYIRRNKA